MKQIDTDDPILFAQDVLKQVIAKHDPAAAKMQPKKTRSIRSVSRAKSRSSRTRFSSRPGKRPTKATGK